MSAGPPSLTLTKAGIGFKSPHFESLRAGATPVGWLEVHAENYFVAGGPRHRELEALRADYPLSLHAVGSSLLSAEPIADEQLRRLGALARRYEPFLVSEHLAWTAWDGHSFNDLLPAPYTAGSLDHAVANVQRLQEAIGRPLLVENPSLYLEPAGSEMTETEFLAQLCARSGCGLLLDINNVVVSTANLGGSAEDYLAAVDPGHVGEIHLAGHAIERHGDLELRIDDHGSKVGDTTWALYRRWIQAHGPRPSLVEWDTEVPAFAVLAAEAARAGRVLAGQEAWDAA